MSLILIIRLNSDIMEIIQMTFEMKFVVFEFFLIYVYSICSTQCMSVRTFIDDRLSSRQTTELFIAWKY